MNSEPEIIQLLGIDTTLKLERALGGQRKYIASRPGDLSPIVNAIGKAGAEKLASRFGGMLLYIPQHLASRMRNRDIRRAVWAGEHKRDIGQRFGLVERTIRKIMEGDNHPRLGLTCRRLRAQVQGYRHDRTVQRAAHKQSGAQHGGAGTPGR